MDGPVAVPDVEQVRRAYDRVIYWYKVAESKAQIILTVNGTARHRLRPSPLG